MTQKLIFLFTLIFLSSAQCNAKPTDDLIHEYGRQMSLDGVVVSRVYPGPPNYESIRGGDEAEHIWLLKLRKPIGLKDDGDPTSNNEAEKNIREIQLVIRSLKNEQLLKKSVGHPVRLTGALFHALTGHHHLKILLDVKCVAMK